MRPIKFRQRNGDRWHYWGFIDDAFVTPCRYDTPSQQFTGLTDRYGVEVFEGDIVSREKEKPWAVGHEPYGFYTDASDLERYLERGDPYEVIGNITENPELLK